MGAIKRTNIYIFFIILLNIFDAYFTYSLIKIGHAQESNPFLNHALENYGFGTFFAIKFSLLAFGCYILWKYKENRVAQLGTIVCLMVYLLVIVYFCNHFI